MPEHFICLDNGIAINLAYVKAIFVDPTDNILKCTLMDGYGDVQLGKFKGACGAMVAYTDLITKLEQQGTTLTWMHDNHPGISELQDAFTPYLHVKYSPVENPTEEQMTDTPDAYIGTYTDGIQADSTDPKAYKWVRIDWCKGKDGKV